MSCGILTTHARNCNQRTSKAISSNILHLLRVALNAFYLSKCLTAAGRHAVSREASCSCIVCHLDTKWVLRCTQQRPLFDARTAVADAIMQLRAP